MRSILDALKSILNAIFGGSSTVPKEPTSKPDPRPTTPPKPKDPPIVQPKDEPELPPQPEVPDLVDLDEDDEIIAQDGAEIQPDTVVVVINEKDLEIIEETVNEEAPTTETETTEDIYDEAAEQVEPSDKPTLPADGSEVDLDEIDSGNDVTIPDTPDEVLETHNARYLWCLDNGHGSLTRGKRSPLFEDRKTRFFEYEFNRDVVARIVAKLDEVGVKYYVTVPEVDVDNYLETRVKRANEKRSILPKIFVSVHSNAAPARSANDWAPASISGIETWHFHGSKMGQKIAGVFQKHILAKTGWKNRHLKSRPNNQFYVLRKTRMPAVLTENGFYNNKLQAAELMKPAIRQKIADAHVAAILELEEKGINGVGLQG
ncbi:MAG: N-acetylmuramoyl-L-alanine amidase [Saprospiraceae bacterium]